MAIRLEVQQKIYELGQQVPFLSNKEIARRLGVSDHSVAKFRGTVPETLDDWLDEKTHLADAKTIERLRIDNTRLRGMNRLLTRGGTATVESIMEQFKVFLSSEEAHQFRFKPTAYPIPKPVKQFFDKDHEEVAALVLSDWHLGETIRPQESNGVNKYNTIICANRLWKVIDKFKRITLAHMSMYKVKKIWLSFLGDIINGTIHPEFLYTNDLLDIPSAVLAARLAIMVVYELKTLGIPIEIDCVVGNHARLVPLMPAKRQAHLSHDWSVYMAIEQEFRDDKQVTVRVHDGQFGVVKQEGWRFVLEHGYGAKAGEELPERLRRMFDSPIFREATGLTGTSVDMVLIGDKHRFEQGQGYMVNGGLAGQGEYGVLLRLDPIEAVQWSFGISKEQVTTYQYPLRVTNYVDETAGNVLAKYATEFMERHGR